MGGLKKETICLSQNTNIYKDKYIDFLFFYKIIKHGFKF